MARKEFKAMARSLVLTEQELQEATQSKCSTKLRKVYIKASSISKDDQIYVGGLSMGGMGTFEIVSRRPDLFAAAIAICGGAHPARAKTIAGNVPMWIFHGAQDNVVLPSYSTDMVIAIRKLGGTANYTLYKDANHGSWNNAFAEPELISWLYSNKKK